MEKMPDYSKYTLEELFDVRDHIDKDKYPEIYDIILSEISKKEAQKPLRMQPIETLSPIEKRILWIRRTYFILILISSAFLIISCFMVSSKTDQSFSYESLITVIAYSLVYYGLLRRKPWTINLVLIVSALSIILGMVYIFIPIFRVIDLVGKGVNMFFLLFFMFQIYFFRRDVVKKLFMTGNTDII